MKHTICLDFDGVCNTYNGWKGDGELFQPREGVFGFIQVLVDHNYKVAIFSTRPVEKLRDWFLYYFKAPALGLIESGNLYFPDRKPAADVYLDDRGMLFKGTFDSLLIKSIKEFKAYWEA